MKHIIWTVLCAVVLMGSVCDTPEPGSPDAGLYHNYAEVTQELAQLQSSFPAIAKVISIGKSTQGRDLWAIKISDNVNAAENEPAILFVGGHHAREWISIDVPFLLAKELLEQYQTNPQVKNYIDNGEIWILPLLNPDGHQHSIVSDRLWRKNRRNNGDGTFGVDLNRNYGFGWGGPGSSGDTYSDTYRGTSAFSEMETQAIQRFINQHPVRALVSYHNYSQLVLFPWGHTNNAAPDQGLLKELATEMADRIFSVHSKKYIPEQSSDLYLASGDATDWLYGETRTPSFTIELRPNSSRPGFILPEGDIQPTFQENWPAALFMIEWTQLTTTMKSSL